MDEELKHALIDVLDAGSEGWLGGGTDPDLQAQTAAQAMLDALRQHSELIACELGFVRPA